MIGFVTDKTTSDAILAGIEQAMAAHGQPNYWTTGAFPIYSGEYKGGTFIPASDELLATPLRGGLTPMDFPETHAMLDALGGLGARIHLHPSTIIDPDQPEP